jgi:hypothetical protein
MDSSTHFLLKHLLKKQEPPNKKISAVWRSAHQYASDLQTHDFASPPHDGFAVPTYPNTILSWKKNKRFCNLLVRKFRLLETGRLKLKKVTKLE